MKNSNDIGNRTRDLPTCSAVPQPTASPAACLQLQRPFKNNVLLILYQDHIIFVCIILAETCKILRCWYQRIWMFGVTYFTAVDFKEILQ